MKKENKNIEYMWYEGNFYRRVEIKSKFYNLKMYWDIADGEDWIMLYKTDEIEQHYQKIKKCEIRTNKLERILNI